MERAEMVRRGAEAAWRVDWPGAEWEFASVSAEDREWYGRVAEAVLGAAYRAPDAITDEMVERGRSAYWGPTYGGSVVGRVRAILTAALTEPPARPEGAGDIEAVLREEWSFSDEDGGEEAFADLAERLAKRGVRVVTEEQS